MSNARFFISISEENLETRQRLRYIGITMSLIMELAQIYDLDERLAATRALSYTYADSPPRSFFRGTEEIEWTLDLMPFKEFYKEPIYKLTVRTTEPALK